MEIPEPLIEELSRRPDVAFSLGQVTRHTQGHPASTEDLLRGLARRPDLVRLVDVWRGPLRALGPDPAALPPEMREALRRNGLGETTWIVPLGRAECPGGRWVQRRLRETVRYLGRIVDVDSPRAVTRWMRIVVEGRLLGDTES